MIILTTTPDNTSDFFAYNPIYFDASSNDANIVRVIFDVYVNQVYRTSIQRSPNLGTTDEFSVDLSNILQAYLTPELEAPYSGLLIAEASTSALEYSVRAFEVLDNGTTFDTSWAEDGGGTVFTQSLDYFAINGGVQRDETSTDYNATSTSKLFLTNRPDSAKVLDDTDFQIGFYSTNQTGAIIVEKDSAGSTLATNSIAFITPQYNKGWVGIDASALNALTASIEVTLNTDPLFLGSNISETRTYQLTDDCNEDTVRLFWQNPLGGQDYYHFSGNREKRRRSNRTTYEKKLPRNPVSKDRGDDVLNVNSTVTYQVFTRTVSEEIIEWLSEIGRSQSVFWKDGDDFRPVIVTGTTIVLSNDEDARTQFAVTFRLASEETNQRG